MARLFDFELSFLGRKHFAESIIDGVGVSALCGQAVFQADRGLNNLPVFIIGKI